MKIISLTTIPPRFPLIGPTLESLLLQGADDVLLYIPNSYDRFPGWSGVLPKVPYGVKIKRCDVDYGPATKILAAAKEFKGTSAQILFCDDDVLYKSGWARRLFKVQEQRPDEVIAGYVRRPQVDNVVKGLRVPRAQEIPITRDYQYRFKRLLFKIFFAPHPARRPISRAGYGEILFGVSGAVVRPEFFDELFYQIPNYAWFVDDIWLSANFARRKIPIFAPSRLPLPMASDGASVDALLDTSVDGKNRQELNRQVTLTCQKDFLIWLE